MWFYAGFFPSLLPPPDLSLRLHHNSPSVLWHFLAYPLCSLLALWEQTTRPSSSEVKAGRQPAFKHWLCCLGFGKHCDVFGLLTMTSRHIEDHCIGMEHVQRKGGWKRPFTVQAILSLLRSHTAYDVFTFCLIQIISYAVMMIYSMIHRKGFQTLTLNMTE